MNTKERTEILCEASLPDLISWREQIEEMAQLDWMKTPKLGLVMMRAQESVDQIPFNVGEILISEASVSVDGNVGYGICMGHDDAKAEALACIEAIYQTEDAKWVIMKQELSKWLNLQFQNQAAERQKNFKIMQRTRVDFDVVDEELKK